MPCLLPTHALAGELSNTFTSNTFSWANGLWRVSLGVYRVPACSAAPGGWAELWPALQAPASSFAGQSAMNKAPGLAAGAILCIGLLGQGW